MPKNARGTLITALELQNFTELCEGIRRGLCKDALSRQIEINQAVLDRVSSTDLGFDLVDYHANSQQVQERLRDKLDQQPWTHTGHFPWQCTGHED